MERDWVGEINKLKRPLVEFQQKINWKKSKTQVLPTCSPGPLSEDAAVGHSTDRCRVPWRVTSHIGMVVNSHGKIPRFFWKGKNSPLCQGCIQVSGKVFFNLLKTSWHTTRTAKAWEGATHSSPFKLPWVMLKAGSWIRGFTQLHEIFQWYMNPWPESSQLRKPITLAHPFGPFSKARCTKNLERDEKFGSGTRSSKLQFSHCYWSEGASCCCWLGVLINMSPVTKGPPSLFTVFLRGWHPIQL